MEFGYLEEGCSNLKVVCVLSFTKTYRVLRKPIEYKKNLRVTRRTNARTTAELNSREDLNCGREVIRPCLHHDYCVKDVQR